MSENIKHIVALVIILLIFGGMYYVSQSGTLFKGFNDRSTQVKNDTEQLKSEIIVPLKKIQNVTIDTSFFDSPGYKALEDKSVTLTSPQLERENPFAPIIQ